MTIYIGQSWLDMAGMKVGDRVDFLFDRKSKIGAITRRKDKRGYMISKHNADRSRISFTWRDGMPYADGMIEFFNVSVDGDALKFSIPRECFDGQRRLKGVA